MIRWVAMAVVMAACALARGQPPPASAAPSSTVSVAWNPVPGATNYQVWYGTNSGVYFTNQSTAGTTLSISGLNRGVTWFYAVTATASGVTSPYSQEISSTVVIPSPPTGVTVIVTKP